MELPFILNATSSCMDWILALVLIAVGAMPVRKAEPRAGLLVIGAGALWLVSSCCGFIPDLRWQLTHPEPGVLEATIIPLFTLLLYAVGLAALIAAAVVMARALTALGGGAK